MIDIAGCHEPRNVFLGDLHMEIGHVPSKSRFDLQRIRSSHVSREQPMDFRPNGVGGKLPFVDLLHWHNATRIDDVVRNTELLWNTTVVLARDKGRVIVGHDSSGTVCKLIENVITRFFRAPKIEDVTNP